MPSNMPIEYRKHTQAEYIQQLNDLYVMLRSKFILQKADGTYSTLERKVSDKIVSSHLKQDVTLGVFSGQIWGKFICFDIDCKDQSRGMAQRLIECLTEQYGFTEKQILVSFSGNKGYHVELFFDNPVRVKDLHKFYLFVLSELKATPSEIEFRNTYTQAVKLPLSINRKTGNECFIVDSQSFQRLDKSFIFQVDKVDSELFLELLEDYWIEDKPIKLVESKNVSITTEQAQDFEEVIAGINLDIPIDYQTRIVTMLETNRLLYPNSRHNSTLLLAIFLKEQGWEQLDVAERVCELLKATWHASRHYFSAETTLEYIDKETMRLVNLVFTKDYKFPSSNDVKPVRIYKEDILFALQPKKIHHRQLLFTMLCHSKKHAKSDGSFYMTYEQMGKMGNTSDRKRLIQHVKHLEENSCIEILRRNEQKEKSYLKHPNVYRMNQTANQETTEFIELDKVNADSFGRVTAQLIPESELKKLVTKNQYYKLFKQYYTA